MGFPFPLGIPFPCTSLVERKPRVEQAWVVCVLAEYITRLSMDHLMAFFQSDLISGFDITDDQVVTAAVVCAAELRRVRLDLPPPPQDAAEHPSRPFGLFVPASVEQQIGRPMLETPAELLRGRRPALHRDSRLSISIPPDGGPVILESLDIQPPSQVIPATTSSQPLPSLVSVDDDENSPAGIPGGQETASNQTASERRAAYAKTHSLKQSPNGIAETTLGFSASMSSNGKTGQTATSGRRKSPGAGKQKDSRENDTETADNAAPQTYGVSVRL